jgi:hypothetical protein
MPRTGGIAELVVSSTSNRAEAVLHAANNRHNRPMT